MSRRVHVRALLLLACGLLLLAPTSSALAFGGRLDPSFGEGGRTLLDLPPAQATSSFYAIEREADGDLLLLAGIESGRRFAIERRTPQGALDPSFGEGGIATVGGIGVAQSGGQPGNEDGDLVGPVAQPGGGVVYAESDRCIEQTRVKRLGADGRSDPGFGGAGGVAVLPFAVQRLAVDPQGRILVLGRDGLSVTCAFKGGPPQEGELARLLPDGALDPSFGNGGIVKLTVAGSPFVPTALAVREDGSVVVGGPGDLVSLTTAGTPDTGFGTDGAVSVPELPAAVDLLPGGSILTASGYSCCGAAHGTIEVRRYLPSGVIDTGFAERGVAGVAPFPGSHLKALAAGPGGSVLVAGRTEPAADCERAACDARNFLVRLTAAGAQDPGFGEAGVVSFPSGTFAGEGPEITALAVGPGGETYAAESPRRFGRALVVALRPDGRVDPSFGRGGLVAERGKVAAHVKLSSVAIEPNGEAVIYASTDSGAIAGRRMLIHVPGGGTKPRLTRTPTPLELIAPAGSGRIYAMWGSYRLVRVLADGRIDRRFGAVRLPGGFAADDLVPRPGGLLVVGNRNGRMAAFEVDANGDPDPRFGRDGLAVIRVGHRGSAISAALDRRGGVVLFGVGPAGTPLVARLEADGSLDRHFGGDGVTARLPLRLARHVHVAILPGGEVAIAAAVPAVGNIRGPRTRLVRLDRRGEVERSFGKAGVVRLPNFVTPLSIFSSAGRLLVATAPSEGGYGGLALSAFRADGAPDRGFGDDGVVREPSTPTLHFDPKAAALTAAGKLLVVGTATPRGGTAQVELLRFR